MSGINKKEIHSNQKQKSTESYPQEQNHKKDMVSARQKQKNTASTIISKAIRKAKSRNKVATLSVGLSLFVAILVIGYLILPAVTLSENTILDCKYEVHQHDQSCYKNVPVYDEDGKKIGEEEVLVCGKADYVVHEHNENCYQDGILVCGLPEITEHIHTEDCYQEQMVLVCDKEEGQPDENGTPHFHDDSCYEKQAVLTCGQQELHEHTKKCYDKDGNLICGLLELCAHEHGDECIKEVEVAEAVSEDVEAVNAVAEDSVVDEDSEVENVAVEDSTDEDVTADTTGADTTESNIPDQFKDDSKSESSNSNEETTNAPSLPAQTFEDKAEGLSGTVTVHVEAPEGAFPEGTTMKLAPVDDKTTLGAIEDTIKDNDEITGTVQTVQAVDITFYDVDGKEVEPASPITVIMSSNMVLEAKKDEDAGVAAVHVDKTGQGNLITTREEQADNDTNNDAANALSFEAESFSVYALVSYTVDFHWEVDGKKYNFSIPGGRFVSFMALVDKLGIADSADNGENESEEKDIAEAQEVESIFDFTVSDSAKQFVDDVESVEFSNPELVWVGKANNNLSVAALKDVYNLNPDYSVELTEDEIEKIDGTAVQAGDWALISLKAFDSEESLTVTMKDGEQFVVKVTDYQISKNVLTADGKTYKITVTFDDAAEIPEGSVLNVEEILAGTKEYKDYSEQAYSSLNTSKTEKETEAINVDDIEGYAATIVSLPEGEKEIGFARFFDISIIYQGKVIEPKIPVNVKIEYLDPIDMEQDEKMQIMHFAEDGIEIITPEVVGNEISFEQSSFSVTATIQTNPNGGDSYALLALYNGIYYEVMFDGTLQEVIPIANASNSFIVSMAEQWQWGPENYFDWNSWVSGNFGLRVSKNNGIEYIDPTASSGIGSTFKSLTRETAGNGYLLSSGNTYLGVATDSTTGALVLSGTNSRNEAVTFFFTSLARTTTGRTVDHIDIGVEAKASVEVPLAYGTYYYADGTVAETVALGEYKNATGTNNAIPISEEDLMSATISSYTLDNGNRVIDNSFIITEYTSSTQVGEIDQVRIGGTFPVGWVTLNGDGRRGDIEQYITVQDQVHYEVALTKSVTLTLQKNRNGTMADLYQRDSNGNLVKLDVSVDVALMSSFCYWDDDNECPGIPYTSGYSRAGTGQYANASLYPSGMDFRLGTTDDTDSNVAAIEIIKYTVNTDGQLISVDSGGTFGFDIYQNVDGDVTAPTAWSGETNANIDYSGYSKVDSRSITIGSSGYGVAYDYSVDKGLVYIQETGNLENSTITDTDGNTWDYVDTYILTEYAWRDPSDDGPPRNNPKIHSNIKQDNTYRAIPDVVGDYYSTTYDGELHNTFLEFYVYNVYKGGEVEFKKVDQSGYMIEGATFELYLTDPSTDEGAITAYRATSAKNAETGNVEVDFGSVAYGAYYMKEVSAPEGYVLDTNIYRVEVFEGESGSESCKIERKTDSGWTELSKQNNLYVFPNSPKYVNDFSITKIDENGKQVNGATLKFERLVTTESGNQYVDYDFDTETSGNQSTVTVGEQNISIGTGKYRISETNVPTGYAKTFDYVYLTVNGETAKVTLNDTSGNAIAGVVDPDDSTKTIYTMTNEDDLTTVSMEEKKTTSTDDDGNAVTSYNYKLQVVNKATRRSVKIRKIDNSDSPIPLQNAKFTMVIDGVTYVFESNADGYLEYKAKIVNNNEVALTEDDPSGILDSLKTGTYILAETVPPDGYIMLEGRVSISVGSEVTSDIATVTAYDENDQEIAEDDSTTEVAYYVISVKNEPGTALPNTGGSGTSLIYLLGIMLTSLAVMGLVMKWKCKAE